MTGEISVDDYAAYKRVVYQNVLLSIQTIVRKVFDWHLEFDDREREKDAHEVLSLDSDSYPLSLTRFLTPNDFAMIQRLWNDEGVQHCFIIP